MYGSQFSLLTDLYQLTMAYGYWKTGRAQQEAVFHLYFRQHPFRGGYTLAAGLANALDWLEGLSFSREDREYLASLVAANGQPLFEPGFLDFLAGMQLSCDIDAVPEGTVVFPNQPLLRVKGPLLQGQLLETALLNVINFQSLVATKAARMCHAAQGDPVLEFGLRRAQGVDGGLAASRAAYIGGVAATSNVLAGKMYGIPVRGTHAHSWVMSFESEQAAFEAYAETLPHNAVFLVDTYDTLEGVRRACEMGHRLRERGAKLLGVRLDSGDLSYLSVAARHILDEAGFSDAVIVASNDLNEHLIRSLKLQGAKINVWGVGTQLATAYDQPALGGVYKLSALRGMEGEWRPKIKLSENAGKITTPGILQVRRYIHNGMAVADALFDVSRGISEGEVVVVDPVEFTHQKRISAGAEYVDLLVPVFRSGQRVYEPPALESVRDHAQRQLALFHEGVKRFEHPHAYPAGLEQRLYEFKLRMIMAAKGGHA